MDMSKAIEISPDLKPLLSSGIKDDGTNCTLPERLDETGGSNKHDPSVVYYPSVKTLSSVEPIMCGDKLLLYKNQSKGIIKAIRTKNDTLEFLCIFKKENEKPSHRPVTMKNIKQIYRSEEGDNEFMDPRYYLQTTLKHNPTKKTLKRPLGDTDFGEIGVHSAKKFMLALDRSPSGSPVAEYLGNSGRNADEHDSFQVVDLYDMGAPLNDGNSDDCDHIKKTDKNPPNYETSNDSEEENSESTQEPKSTEQSPAKPPRTAYRRTIIPIQGSVPDGLKEQMTLEGLFKETVVDFANTGNVFEIRRNHRALIFMRMDKTQLQVVITVKHDHVYIMVRWAICVDTPAVLEGYSSAAPEFISCTNSIHMTTWEKKIPGKFNNKTTPLRAIDSDEKSWDCTMIIDSGAKSGAMHSVAK